MIWSRPIAFIGLAAIPLVFYFIAKNAGRKRAVVDAAFSVEMLERLAPPRLRTFVFLKNAFLFLALVAFVLALAGPKFGRIEDTTPTFGRDIFVLLDVSDSTLAEDVAPNRLTVAKLDVEDLLDAAVGDRIGLIAFAGSAQVEIPLTSDRSFFRELLQNVDTTTVKLGGTAIGDAIRLALSRFGTESGRERSIVLVTDGEDWESAPLEAAQNAADASVPIFSIAIGDLRGAKIPVFDAAGRRAGFKTFDGQEAISKPDVETLKKIAKISGGKYFYADASLDLADVYKNSVDRQKRTRLDEKSRVVLKDRYRPFLMFGLFAFAVYYYFPSRKTSRRTSRRFDAAAQIAIFFSVFSAFSFAATFAQDVPSREVANDVLKNKQTEIDAFNRSADAAKSGRIDDAFRTLAILRNARTPEVAGRANFNLGAAATRRLLEANQKIDENLKSTVESNVSAADNSTNDETLESSDVASASEKQDSVAKYEKDRAKRKELQNKALQEAREAARRFGDAESNRSTRRAAQDAANATIRWEETKLDEWSRAETEARSRRLVDPNERLRWLRDETERRADRVEKLNATPGGVEFYRRLFNEGRTLSELEPDVADLAQKLGVDVEQTRNDVAGAALIGAAKDEFLKRERAAAERFRRYDAASGRDELRRAESELSAIQDVATPYEVLLTQKVEEEEKTSKAFGSSELPTASNEELDEFVRSRGTLRRSVDELIRKAKKEIDSLRAENGQTSEDAANPNNAKIRESMKIAVERGPEIAPLIDEIQRLAVGSTYRDDAKKIADAQRKVLEILKEIAKPLQDENQSNPNQENQENRQNESQNDQNSSKNRQNDDENQKKEDGDSDRFENQDDRSDETPDELNEGKRLEDKDLKNDDQDDQKQNEKEGKSDSPSNDSEEKDASPQKTDKEPEKTVEQKEAEALARQVFRRQKDAEAQRRAVRQALQKREKAGKDW